MTKTKRPLPGDRTPIDPSQLRELGSQASIHDPNSPEMDAMVKSMLLDQRRNERQRRLPVLKPADRPVHEPASVEKIKRVRLTPDLTKVVSALPKIPTRFAKTPAKANTLVKPEETNSVATKDATMSSKLEEDAQPQSDHNAPMAEDVQRPTQAERFKLFVKSYEFKSKHAVWLGGVAIVIWWPWLIPSLVLITVFLVGISYLTVGHERFAEILNNRWVKFSMRYPANASRMAEKAIAFSKAHNARVSRLPEWLAGLLSLPDGSQKAFDDGLPDPFDRLGDQSQET